MPTFDKLLALHRETTAEAGALVARTADADLHLPTPCADWDLADLLAHMIGQQDGFAAAVARGDAPASAYAGPAITPATLLPRWESSARNLDAAFAGADPTADVRLAELDLRVPVALALGMQLLDTAVHAWDVATALGATYRPGAAAVSFVLESARVIAARPGGTPGVFAAPVAERGDDAWADALRLLGREPA